MFKRILLVTVIACAGWPASTAFADSPDCPPLGHLPNYKADPVHRRNFDAFEFPVQKGDETEATVVNGHICSVSYAFQDGGDPMSDLEIQSNYRDQIQKLGAEVLYAGDIKTTARLVKAGKETWLHIFSQSTSIDVTVVEAAAFVATLLPPSGPDYKLLGHMPHFVGAKPEKRTFDKLAFKVSEGEETRDVEIKGAKYVVDYEVEPNAPEISDLEIQTNYRSAISAAGGQIVFQGPNETDARFDQGGQQIWVKIYSQSTSMQIAVIEEKPFQASIKSPDENALKAALDTSGHVALYVNFDFARSTLKPDAAPVVAQVVKLIKDNPGLKLEIDGHTDDIGGADANQKLSEARAAAVVAALVAQGVAANRLSSAGFGSSRPIADNKTDEGRARNRRVELVKK